MKLDEARALAADILGWLAPGASAAEVVGSVRRGKDEVGDVELVVRAAEQANLFAEPVPQPHLLDAAIDAMIVRGRWRWHTPHEGCTTPAANGPRLKRLWVPSAGILVELWVARADNFGVVQALRTGDADFSRALVLKQSAGGLMPRGYFHHDGQLRHLGRGVVPVPDEASYFRELGLAPVPPPQRDADTARQLAHRARQEATT